MRVSRGLAAIMALTGTLLSADRVLAGPVRLIPDLASITFWERTGGIAPTASTFAVDSAVLTTRLNDPLGSSNRDISCAATEFYDVFYSDADGGFSLDGEYLTIEGVFLQTLPAGGGLNLAEIGLNFSGTPTEYGNFVASFIALGNNAAFGTVGNAIDGDLQTHTTMGKTIEQSQRLRVTLGFLSSSGPAPVPEPAGFCMSAAGLAGLAMARWAGGRTTVRARRRPALRR